MELPKMITILQASKETGLSYDAIRKLCMNKEIVHIRAGTKYLINAEKLAQFLNGEPLEET